MRDGHAGLDNGNSCNFVRSRGFFVLERRGAVKNSRKICLIEQ